MARLAWATDLHFDAVNLKRDPRKFGASFVGQADALLLTGDIAQASSFSNCLVSMVEGYKGPIYFVLGNHDVWDQSFADVADKAARLSRKHEHLTWLTGAGITLLSETTALIGTDGWYDARWGPIDPPQTRMNDWTRIKDFKRIWGLEAMPFEARIAMVIERCRERCELIAGWLEPVLRQALAQRPRVIVATHVPPYPQNGIEHVEGRSEEGDRAWLPWYTNKAMGDMLMRVADGHPDKQLDVFCGHAHAAHDHLILPNLRVRTGAATYGKPALAAFVDF